MKRFENKLKAFCLQSIPLNVCTITNLYILQSKDSNRLGFAVNLLYPVRWDSVVIRARDHALGIITLEYQTRPPQ